MKPRFYKFLLLLSTLMSPGTSRTPTNASQPESLLDYLTNTLPQLCPYEPLCHREAQKVPTGNAISCCLPCSCRDHCRLLGNCCPDKEQTTTEQELSLSADMFQCREAADRRHYYMVKQCPSNYSADASVRRNCETALRPGSMIIPASDEASGIIYQNIYCAHCNNAREIIQWKPRVHGPTQIFSHMKLILDGSSFKQQFRLVFTHPAALRSDRCSGANDNLIGTCTKTGSLPSQSQAKLASVACETVNIPFLQFHRNIYCAVCSGHPLQILCSIEVKNDPTFASGFTAVLSAAFTSVLDYRGKDADDKTSPELTTEEQCPDTMAFDIYTESCRELSCPNLKVLSSGRCVNLLKNYGNLNVLLVLKISTYTPGALKKETTESKTQVAWDCLRFLTRGRDDLTATVRDVAEKPATVPGQPYLTVVAAISLETVPEPDILQWLYDRLDSRFSYQSPTGRTFEFRVALNPRIDVAYLSPYTRSLARGTDPTLTDLETNEALDTLYHRPVSSQEHEDKVSLVVLSKLMFCPQLTLNQSEYLAHGSYIVLLRPNRTLYTPEYMDLMQYMGSSDIGVCVQDYMPGTPATGPKVKDQPSYALKIVYALSVVLLAVVIVTTVVLLQKHRLNRSTRSPPQSRND